MQLFKKKSDLYLQTFPFFQPLAEQHLHKRYNRLLTIQTALGKMKGFLLLTHSSEFPLKKFFKMAIRAKQCLKCKLKSNQVSPIRFYWRKGIYSSETECLLNRPTTEALALVIHNWAQRQEEKEDSSHRKQEHGQELQFHQGHKCTTYPYFIYEISFRE